MGNTVNAVNPNTDQTVKIYDQFYSYSADIPQMEYDAVYSYFLSVFGTATQAKNFAVAVFRIAEISQTSAMDLLQQFQGQSQPEITLTLAYYLNTIRSTTTLLGIKAPVTPNFYVARNIRS